MKIVKERTRLIFSEYNDVELRDLKHLVSTMDNTFIYEDESKRRVYLPVGIQDAVEKTFRVSVIDKSQAHWDYATIAEPIGKPFEPRNQMQTDSIEFTLKSMKRDRKVGLILPPGSGKACSNSTLVPTPEGIRRMGDLKIGDYVFGSNGKPTKILAVYPQGEKDMYRVTFSDNRHSCCCKEHLWNILEDDGTQVTKSLGEIMSIYKSYVEEDNRYVYRCRIPVVSAPVEYYHREVKLHPYTIGALIGNSLIEKHLRVHSRDPYVPNKIATLEKLEAELIQNVPGMPMSGYFLKYPNLSKSGEDDRVQTSTFLGSVPELLGTTKIIPDRYIFTDTESRMQLLQGLFDAEGIIGYKKGEWCITYNSCSTALLKQIQYLIRGFGYNADITGWQLIVRAPIGFKQQLFTHPSRKQVFGQANEIDRLDTYSSLTITDIQFDHREEATCITVEAEDQLWLTEDFIVTHNTYVASYCAVKAGLRTLIIAPTTGVRDQWVDSLVQMVKVDPSRIKTISSIHDLISFDGDFAVTLQSTLNGMIKKLDLERLMKDKRFGTKIIDEAHMFFNNIIRVDGSCNFKNNWYLTATFGRSNEEEDELYHHMFGDLDLFRVKDKKPTILNRKPGDIYGQKPHMNVTMLWMNGGLTRQEIASVANSTRYGISIPKYTELIIPGDGTKTEFVRKLIRIVHMADRKTPYGRTLILSPTITSVEVIATHLRKEFPNRKIGTIHSKNDKAENDRVKAEDEVIISTVKSSGTGFDVKDLSKMIVAEQFKSAILAEQVSGRLRRRPDGQDTYMYDIVDRSIRQLRVWGAARAQLLKRKSKKFTVTDM